MGSYYGYEESGVACAVVLFILLDDSCCSLYLLRFKLFYKFCLYLLGLRGGKVFLPRELADSLFGLVADVS